MNSTMVHINELRVRASALTAEQARHLGEIVAERVAELPLAGGPQSRKIPSLTMRVHSSNGSLIEQLANEIVAGIRRSLD